MSNNMIPPVKKMIDLTDATETTTKATAFNTKIRKAAAKMLKNSNIPAYQMIAEDPNFLQKVFLNTEFYQSVLGPGTDLIFTALQCAVADYVTDEVMSIYNNGKAVYPGIWAREPYYNIALRFLRIFTITNEKTGTKTRYLSMNAFDTDEAVKDLPEGSVMKFSDYNPNRFWQYCEAVSAEMINQISMTILMRDTCMALSHSDKETLNERYFVELSKVLVDPIHSYLDGTRPEMLEDDIRGFIKAFEVPFISYMVNLVQSAGINTKLLSCVLDKSTARVVYTLPDGMEATDKLDDIKGLDARIVYTLSFEKDDRIVKTASVEFCIPDLIEAVNVAYENKCGKKTKPERKVKVKVINRIGKAVYDFMKQMVAYAIDCKIVHPTIDYTEE